MGTTKKKPALLGAAGAIALGVAQFLTQGPGLEINITGDGWSFIRIEQGERRENLGPAPTDAPEPSELSEPSRPAVVLVQQERPSGPF